MNELRSNYDSPWKEAIEIYFEEFMQLLFPKIHGHIDWHKGYVFLDKELQQAVHDALTGKRHVDKLVKIWRKDGLETWILIHIEVQSQYDPDFCKRMYIYHYRLFDKYNKHVVSLAVLGDEKENWNPSDYSYSLWECSLDFHFPITKLLDYENKWSFLQESDNLFAVIIMAYLKAIRTKQNLETRLHWKLRLIKMLYERGYNKATIIELFRFIDWLMTLPDDLKYRFEKNLIKYEEEKKMPYITSIEEIGVKRGIEQGIVLEAKKAVIDILKIRFNEIPTSLVNTIHKINTLSILKALRKEAVTIKSLSEFEKIVQQNQNIKE